jgi:hypothetical protein
MIRLDILFPYQLQRYAIDKRRVLFSERKIVQETGRGDKSIGLIVERCWSRACMRRQILPFD